MKQAHTLKSIWMRIRPQLHLAAMAAVLLTGSGLAQTSSSQLKIPANTESETPAADQTEEQNEAVDAATARQQLRALSEGLHSLQAEFSQYQLTADGGKKDPNSGTVALKEPNRFRWHYRQPQEQLIIATGKQILIYDPDLEQLTIKPQDNEENPLYVLFNPDLIDKHYRIADSFRRQGLVWIKIIPLQPQENVQAVWLGINPKAHQLEKIQMRDKLDQVVVFQFGQIQRNPKLQDDLFRFNPPAGTDVVRDQPQPGEF